MALKENQSSTQYFNRTDGRVQKVDLHSSFQPSTDVHVKGNFYKHLDSMAHDFAGPGTQMSKLVDVAKLTISGKQRLDDQFISAVQSN